MPHAKTFKVLYRPAPLDNEDENIPTKLLSKHDTLDEANRAAKAFLLNYLTSLDKNDFFGFEEFI
jgi:hypothetical protein